MIWRELSDGRRWIVTMDGAPRLVPEYGVFQEATAGHAI
jgi:hypothetical protein